MSSPRRDLEFFLKVMILNIERVACKKKKKKPVITWKGEQGTCYAVLEWIIHCSSYQQELAEHPEGR